MVGRNNPPLKRPFNCSMVDLSLTAGKKQRIFHLNKNFEMRETHHRPQTFFVISQLTQTPA